MNTRDIENNKKLIEFYTKYMGYQKASLDYAIEQINNTWVDDEYRKFLGPDLRRRWKVDSSISGEEAEEVDLGYSEFKKFFHSFTCKSCLQNKVNVEEDRIVITPDIFNENLVPYKKNMVKLKKFIVEMYNKHHPLLLEDVERMSRDTAMKINEKMGQNVSVAANNGTMYADGMFEQYVVKIFEFIGTKKNTKKNDFELVLSCNFADMLLSSTSENWSSCFSLTGGPYWFGVPGLIGDKNRAFLYTTRGKKKNYLGIEVDSVVNRSWVLLDNANIKNIVRFYPSRSNLLALEKIKKTTEDPNWRYCEDMKSNAPGKHKIWPLFFEGGIYSSVSNDKCGLEGKPDGIHMVIRNGGGTQYFTEDFKAPNWDSIETNTTYLPSLIKDGRKASSMFVLKKCSCCNSTRNLDRIVYNDGKRRDVIFICTDCLKKHYVKCSECNDYYKKEDEALIVHEKKQYCKKCFDRYFEKCSCCDTLTHKGKILAAPDGKRICKTCFDKTYVRCETCGTFHKKEEAKDFINVNGRTFCKKCHSKYFKVCDCCGKTKEKEHFKKVENVEVCIECYENKEVVYKCRDCKKKYVMKNIFIIHDGADGPEGKKKKRCKTCAPKLFPNHFACKKCGELWELERLHEDGTCPVCNNEAY